MNLLAAPRLLQNARVGVRRILAFERGRCRFVHLRDGRTGSLRANVRPVGRDVAKPTALTPKTLSIAALRPRTSVASSLLGVRPMSLAYGTVVSLADAIELCVPLPNRRRETRRRPSDVRWLRGARLKYGPEVVIIDISVNGILVRSPRKLEANAPVALEFSGATGNLLVLARVLRSRRIGTGDLVSYEIACRFKRPVAFPGLVAQVRERATPKARIVQVGGSQLAAAGSLQR